MKPDWTSVKDRLPKHGDFVLIVFGNSQTIAMARAYFHADGIRWLDMPGTNEFKPDFWMPLPEPPPKPDPFEVWWWAKVNTSAWGNDVKEVCRRAWDAALKSKEQGE